jgi:hypothetical protein
LILLLATVAGIIVGWLWARWQGQAYQVQAVRFPWLALIAFLPQFFVFYLPATRERMPDGLAAASLILSLVLLLAFAWLNRRLAGMGLLILGLVMNLTVISTNSGFMPISPQIAAHLVSEETLDTIELGARFGRKDILLAPEHTCFGWLSDRFLLPEWSPYQVAFSVGDILIAAGAFWLLARRGRAMTIFTREKV